MLLRTRATFSCWTSGMGLLLLSACGSVPDSLGPVPPRHRVLQGSVSPVVQELAGERYRSRRSACDDSFLPQELEITQALDDRALEIESDHPFPNPGATPNPRGENGASPLYEVVRLGTFPIRRVQWGGSVREGWQEDAARGWKQLIEVYQRIKYQPMNGDWISLNMEVRALLVDDENRVRYGANVYLTHESVQSVPALRSAVQTCLVREDCVDPWTGTSLVEIARSNAIYRTFLEAVSVESLSGRKRDILRNLLVRLEFDQTWTGFNPNPGAKRIGGTTIDLPLDLGDFQEEGQGAALARMIEHVWSNDANQVHIHWSEPAQAPELFRLFNLPGMGGRSYVDRSQHRVALAPMVRDRSIAHEVGHVLGFGDHYYTVWNPENCAYQTQTLDVDLMSNTNTGQVVPEEWSQLKSSYPVTGS